MHSTGAGISVSKRGLNLSGLDPCSSGAESRSVNQWSESLPGSPFMGESSKYKLGQLQKMPG